MTYPIAIGAVVSVKDQRSNVKQYIVSSYDERMYMKMVDSTNKKSFMTIHPEHAERIAANKAQSIKVLDTHALADIFVTMTNKVVNVKLTPVATPVATKTVIIDKSKTKKQLATEIKAANPTASRKQLIEMFVSQLGMTPAGASTYASMK